MMKEFLLCPAAFAEIGADSSNQKKGVANEVTRRGLQWWGASPNYAPQPAPYSPVGGYGLGYAGYGGYGGVSSNRFSGGINQHSNGYSRVAPPPTYAGYAGSGLGYAGNQHSNGYSSYSNGYSRVAPPPTYAGSGLGYAGYSSYSSAQPSGYSGTYEQRNIQGGLPSGYSGTYEQFSWNTHGNGFGYEQRSWNTHGNGFGYGAPQQVYAGSSSHVSYRSPGSSYDYGQSNGLGVQASYRHESRSAPTPTNRFSIVYSDSTSFLIWAVVIATVVVVVLIAFCCICRKRRAKNREAQQARRAGIRAPVGRPIGSTSQMTGFAPMRTTRRDPGHTSLRIHKRQNQNSISECTAQSLHMQESRRSSGRNSQSSLSMHRPQSLAKHMSRSNSMRKSPRSSKHNRQSVSKYRSQSSANRKPRHLSKRKTQSSSKSSKHKSGGLKSSSAQRHLKKGISEERAKRAATGLE